ncbi:translation initiation factor IF-2-like [Mesocricetus auratus]|uniref:Translation initiation factor IF-2-like n=1 Tax=Mesocricetus auratus TaxID=10036 RepID=A0ABM2X3J6_MESAU|nr:translation initiation factor IF-2-like [Mesocricetus auratus]
MGAGAVLTRQRLLRPRQQQHSRRPPAPSSAAALASAAATNRPCGAANRHNRRRPAAQRPARPRVSEAAGWGAAAAQVPRSARAPSPPVEALGPEAAGAPKGRVAAAAGFVIVNSALPPQSTPGNSQPGEGRSGQRSQAAAQMRKSPSCWDGRGWAPGRRARPVAPLSCPDPGRYCGPSVVSPKVSLTFWPRQADPAKPGAAPGGESEAEEGAPAQLRGPRPPPE